MRGTLTFQQKAAQPTLTVITAEVTSWEEERASSQPQSCQEAKEELKYVFVSRLQQ